MSARTEAQPPRVVDVVAGASFERVERPGCPLCGRVRPYRTVPAHFDMTALVAECRECRIAYQSPRPPVAASIAYMESRWASGDAYVADVEGRRRRAASQVELLARLVPPGRLLDFGAGTGTFVTVARESGWDAEGVERSARAVARASAEHGTTLRRDLNDVSGSYDVITLWDVIEHLREPEAEIRGLLRLLRPGGWVILETGNWESWTRLERGDSWGLYLFDHQFYFSPASLEAVLARAGLKRFRLIDHGRRRPPLEPAEDATEEQRVRWEAYLEAKKRWPSHVGIDIMIAAAQR